MHPNHSTTELSYPQHSPRTGGMRRGNPTESVRGVLQNLYRPQKLQNSQKAVSYSHTNLRTGCIATCMVPQHIKQIVAVGTVLETLVESVAPLVIDVIPGGCPNMPSAFQNLLDLLRTLIQTGVMFGIVLAVFGVTVSGILYLLPGQNRDRLARRTFKYTLIGLLIVIVGPSFVGFIVSELNPLCG